MLVTFKSKAAGDLFMFEENAKQILDLFGKDVHQGIITAAEIGPSIQILEEEIAHQKIKEAQEKEAREKEEEEESQSSFDPKPSPKKTELPVPFSVRAYPFLQMLRAAHKKETHIAWGI